jgi:phosphonopyruvate decarboxylase
MSKNHTHAEYLSGLGYTHAVGVPCSLLTPLLSELGGIGGNWYLAAANEGEAVAIAAGIYLSGGRTLVFMQNSGLWNAMSPLLTLCKPYEIPIDLLIGFRGQPDSKDEQQHLYSGELTLPTLQAFSDDVRFATATEGMLRLGNSPTGSGIHSILVTEPVARQLTTVDFAADAETNRQKPQAITLDFHEDANCERPSRRTIVELLLKHGWSDAAVVASTGMISRELWEIADADRNFYMAGSMGCASSIGLGLRLGGSKARVIVIDGDGAAAMRLENFITIGNLQPRSFLHLVLDNGVHASTGGQLTASSTVSFASVAKACSYKWAARCTSEEGLLRAIQIANTMEDGPVLIEVAASANDRSKPRRPTIRQQDLAKRFSAFARTSRVPPNDRTA